MGGGPPYLELFVEETSFYNRIVLGTIFPNFSLDPFPHILQTWLRNCVGGFLIYFFSGFLWCFYIYYWKRNVYVPKDSIPSNKSMLLQILVTIKAMPLYCVLPTFAEYVVEHDWTKCYPRVLDVGWPAYAFHIITYLTFIEFCIYWMHRGLHDIKPLYKYLHAKHHIYNKKITLSPFAGLAFHPMDGILQAIPHLFALFLIPTHFRTHIVLLFFEVVWTANIHDGIHSRMWPVMGAGYHTIHHTRYRYNYGHYSIWMDWMFGTLLDPMDIEAKGS
ncbi:delta(7)-sterol-C5(6)-desaturase [Cucumis sativus]|uniref:Fatty acid hydroxylase domain-containing protein n=1 Tax=Cucumis sativus TaxID=3659 RepID=A0A0A0L3B9_CUCSA|nr:delta(7)-sterol-C5(6)-desaturase [Cucumis sativus]KGN54626.1 hypothetical protein Csa_012304 [Cucumis sativus]